VCPRIVVTVGPNRRPARTSGPFLLGQSGSRPLLFVLSLISVCSRNAASRCRAPNLRPGTERITTSSIRVPVSASMRITAWRRTEAKVFGLHVANLAMSSFENVGRTRCSSLSLGTFNVERPSVSAVLWLTACFITDPHAALRHLPRSKPPTTRPILPFRTSSMSGRVDLSCQHGSRVGTLPGRGPRRPVVSGTRGKSNPADQRTPRVQRVARGVCAGSDFVFREGFPADGSQPDQMASVSGPFDVQEIGGQAVGILGYGGMFPDRLIRSWSTSTSQRSGGR
jgi:hypothetical protein